MKYILPFLLMLGCTVQKEVVVVEKLVVPSKKIAKNVIFLIGDGMGLSQITAAMYSNNGEKLNIERFKELGLHKSHSADDLITDSAAGATAFAIGMKTNNAFVGVCPANVDRFTLVEEAESKAMPTGLIATSTIVHATPASFYAHCPNRRDYEEIAGDILDHEIDILIGGGLKYFTRRETDSLNVLEELQKRNYRTSTFLDKEVSELELDKGYNYIYITSDSDPLMHSQGRDYLFSASTKSIKYLNEKSENGFFIMIEGSQIDWGGHANNADYVIDELLEFDEVIGYALDFAKKDGETLVVVTADHETGGLAINPGSKRDSLVTAFTSSKHTADMIPVFAYGPGAELFQGIYENTDIYFKIREALGWEHRTP